MIVDANILLYAVDSTSPHHVAAARWLESVLNGDLAVGLPWQTLGAFVRISTHPRIQERPLTGPEAWAYIDEWLATPPASIPPATEATARIYGDLCAQVSITGNLVPDGMLAALAIERGVEVISHDADFARFPGVRWRDPIGPASA